MGIKEALDSGADVVICPRVTDAAVVIGPAAWKFNWQRNDYDKLAGALAAGHLIECGAQVTEVIIHSLEKCLHSVTLVIPLQK